MHFAVGKMNQHQYTNTNENKKTTNLWISSSDVLFIILMNFVCSRHASIAPDDDFKCHAVKLNRIAMGATDRPQSGQIVSKVAIGRFDYWEIPTDNCVYLTYRHIKKHDNQNNDLIRLEINDFILVENCLFLFSFASSAKYIFMVSIINHIVYYGIFFFIFFLMTHLLHDGFDQTRRCHTYWKSKFNKLYKQWTKLVLFAVDWFQNIKCTIIMAQSTAAAAINWKIRPQNAI